MKNSDEFYKESVPFSQVAKAVIPAWLVAGTMDISAALLVYSVILAKVGAVTLLQSIAGGIFGKAAFAGGTATAVYGVIFHYIIALGWTTAFFLAFPYIPFLRKHPIISGLLYGAFVWSVMNLVVLPLSNASPSPLKWDSVLLGAGILMVCIGLPISLLARRFYTSKKIS